ncbi:MAG: hypothetical protein AAFY60_01205 [Myxococcota bacterium]
MFKLKTAPLLVCSLFVLGLGTATAQDLDSEVKALTFVGFQQYSEASRVFVRTNEKVKFRVDDGKRDTIVLILENTEVTAVNHLNHLDTRFFDSPVDYVQPRLIEGTSPSVQIEIALSESVPYETIQNDNFLAIDFKRQ